MSSALTKSLPSGADKNKMRKASAALFRLPKPLQMPFVCHELHPTPFDIPMRWKPQRELMVRALRVAFADFSAAPWQGLEKSERCPNNSSLFRPQAAVVVVAVQVLTGPQSGIRHHLTFLGAGTRRGSWRSGPYGLRLLIFPQPLGRALKNQNAAPTTPPCFGRRPRSSSLLFKFWLALRAASDTL